MSDLTHNPSFALYLLRYSTQGVFSGLSLHIGKLIVYGGSIISKDIPCSLLYLVFIYLINLQRLPVIVNSECVCLCLFDLVKVALSFPMNSFPKNNY